MKFSEHCAEVWKRNIVEADMPAEKTEAMTDISGVADWASLV
jgi:hypothetical protein